MGSLVLVGTAAIRVATGSLPGALTLGVLVAAAPLLVWLIWWAAVALSAGRKGEQWWIAHDPTRGTAVLTTSAPDARGRVKISNFGAHPRRTGLGTTLAKTVIDAQRQQGRTVHATAFRGVASKYYRDQLGLTATPICGTLGLYWRISG